MKNFKSLEVVGNKSTTATINGESIGHNVNAFAYQHKSTGEVHVYLESGGEMVIGVKKKVLANLDAYEAWKESISQTRPLFAAAIESFRAQVLL